ncbi:hypothetical protein T552_02348 [Pneumocystis carinii B80]|uniref:Association with the SNF1 complex (ASC) domain-containing protein n=1 Tax=Pneumocystis carinii (strain B80) TaxID=1408658 RepID=A0A0W4ZG95_PNEC8|nr:hypothetical protein T552_02348 [Pneumocystis carinii B80]KTW27369.1 hypothetical protein T552_02348 [Pneumocystis carinii B80]
MGNSYSQENLSHAKDPLFHSLNDKNENFSEELFKKDITPQKNRNSDVEESSSSVNSETDREPLNLDSLNDLNKTIIEDKGHTVQDSSIISPISENIEHELKQQNREKSIPVFLHWKGDHQNVYVTGTFTGWGKKIPLNKSVNDFTVLIHLPKGTHRFKFLVDNEWKCSDELATATDSSGNLVNYIEVNDACLSSMFQADKQASLTEHRATKPVETYTNRIPALYDEVLENNTYRIFQETSVPPSLPPHLEKVILNSNSTMKDDQSVLPNPNHVVLNHLAASSIRNGVFAVSVTTRFRHKYVTTILYKSINV